MKKTYKNISLEDWSELSKKIRITYDSIQNNQLLIIGGSEKSIYSIILSSWAASLTGVNSLYIMIPEKTFNAVASKLSWGNIISFSDMKITHGVVKKVERLLKRRKINPRSVLVGVDINGISREFVNLLNLLINRKLRVVITSNVAIHPEIINEIMNHELLISLESSKLSRLLKNLSLYSESESYDSLLTKLYESSPSTFLIKYDNEIRILNKEYQVAIPTRRKVLVKDGIYYILTGLLAGLYSLLEDSLYSSILSSLIVVKTGENIFENYGLHYTIENFMNIMQDTLISYMKDKEFL